MNTFSHVPPGFRFHPTDEELVDYYLRKKVASKRIDLDVIRDVDLYKIEPWDLQELCKLGTEEQNEWYFFSHKDKKYPTGTRTNRATKAGFWKATGRDKAIYARHCLVGMRKTLVFYKGRAPNGQKSDWIMHEYRLETNENATPQEEGWVVCRVFKKRMTTVQKVGDYESPCWYDEQVSFMQDHLESDPRPNISHPNYAASFPCKQELQLQHNIPQDHGFLRQFPQLESPKVPQSAIHVSNYGHDHRNNASGAFQSSSSVLTQEHHLTQQYCSHQLNSLLYGSSSNEQAVDPVSIDWRVLDKFVASQLSQDHQDAAASKETSYISNNVAVLHVVGQAQQITMLPDEAKTPEIIAQEYASTSTSSSQLDLWK